MRQLNPRRSTHAMDEARDARVWFDVRVAPDSRVAGTDAALRGYTGRFDENQVGAAHRATAQVDQMPVVWHSVDRRILAHGRNDNSIPQCDAADRERTQQIGGHLAQAPIAHQVHGETAQPMTALVVLTLDAVEASLLEFARQRREGNAPGIRRRKLRDNPLQHPSA